MFVVSMKMTRKKTIALLFLGLMLGIWAATTICASDPFASTIAKATSYTDLSAADNEARIAFLARFGWEVDREPIEAVNIAIPTEFNAVYQQYQSLQKEQGFDLMPYRGKAVKRWSYQVLNYPNAQPYVKANLLVYEDKIIGGDICSTQIDGFMHGFELPAAE